MCVVLLLLVLVFEKKREYSRTLTIVDPTIIPMPRPLETKSFKQTESNVKSSKRETGSERMRKKKRIGEREKLVLISDGYYTLILLLGASVPTCTFPLAHHQLCNVHNLDTTSQVAYRGTYIKRRC